MGQLRGRDGKTFWERVQEALRDQGVTRGHQTHVANLLGIKPPSVWEWANGISQPTGERARELAARLRVATPWLLDGLGDKRPVPSDAKFQRLIEVWGLLSESAKDQVLGFAEGKASPLVPPHTRKEAHPKKAAR